MSLKSFTNRLIILLTTWTTNKCIQWIDLLELNILDLLYLYHIERTMNIKHCQDQLYMKKIVSRVNLIWKKIFLNYHKLHSHPSDIAMNTHTFLMLNPIGTGAYIDKYFRYIQNWVFENSQLWDVEHGAESRPTLNQKKILLSLLEITFIFKGIY